MGQHGSCWSSKTRGLGVAVVVAVGSERSEPMHFHVELCPDPVDFTMEEVLMVIDFSQKNGIIRLMLQENH